MRRQCSSDLKSLLFWTVLLEWAQPKKMDILWRILQRCAMRVVAVLWMGMREYDNDCLSAIYFDCTRWMSPCDNEMAFYIALQLITLEHLNHFSQFGSRLVRLPASGNRKNQIQNFYAKRRRRVQDLRKHFSSTPSSCIACVVPSAPKVTLPTSERILSSYFLSEYPSAIAE